MKRKGNRKEIISARIADQTCVAPGFHLLRVYVPAPFLDCVPGQFVMVRIGEGEPFFLPRPISIHSVYKLNRFTVCELLYQVVGKGTLALSRLKKGGRLLVQGPLGRGFEMPAAERRVVLVAGGMGVAPIQYLAERIASESKRSGQKREIICYQGARTGDLLLELDRLRNACADLRLSTDDGSRGYGGTVTELFARDLPILRERPLMVYACGPHPMLRSLHREIRETGIACQVSIEEKMACGVGACLGCAVKDSAGGYRCACKEGPVFDLEELAWDESEP